MENYSKDTLRSVLNQRKKEKRGSVFITVLIIFIFALGGLFYVKTSCPDIFSKAVSCVKGYFTQEKDKPEDTQTVLQTADTIEFTYISKNFLSEDEFSTPLEKCVVTSLYGPRTDPVTGRKKATHHGIDLASDKGSSIFACKDGKVIRAEYDDIFGNCVTIDHGDFESFYAHMSSLDVKCGDRVSSGDKIGVIGTSGKSTGVHLHFEIIKEGERVDPMPYLYEKI